MSRSTVLLVSLLGMSVNLIGQSGSPTVSTAPEIVEFHSGSLRLRGWVFRPGAGGRHPAVLFLHGSGQEYDSEMLAVRQVYASRGYLLFVPFRRGQGLSVGQGEAIVARLDRDEQAHGPASRMRLVADLLSTEQMDDAVAGLDYLRKRPDVDPTRIAVAGNSAGGILAVFSAERAEGIKAVVASAPAAQTWARAPELRERLLRAARNARVPIFFFQAENDYDLAPTEQLSAEMARVQKPFARKIFPAFGDTKADGHSFGYFGGRQWGPDVFAFLAKVVGADSSTADRP
jgi:dienelactone hydrolase